MCVCVLEREGGRDPIHWFTTQEPEQPALDQGWCQEARTQSTSPLWVSGAWLFVLTAGFQGICSKKARVRNWRQELDPAAWIHDTDIPCNSYCPGQTFTATCCWGTVICSFNLSYFFIYKTFDTLYFYTRWDRILFALFILCVRHTPSTTCHYRKSRAKQIVEELCFHSGLLW